MRARTSSHKVKESSGDGYSGSEPAVHHRTCQSCTAGFAVSVNPMMLSSTADELFCCVATCPLELALTDCESKPLASYQPVDEVKMTRLNLSRAAQQQCAACGPSAVLGSVAYC